VVVATSISYLARWSPASDHPLALELGMLQLGNDLGSGVDIEARHQIVLGASYHF
jgi:hypothetical protein